MEDSADQQEEEFLKELQSLCQPSAYDQLIVNLQKKDVLGILKNCCRECNTLEGAHIQEKISKILLYIIKELHFLQFDSDHDEENEQQSVSSLHEVVSLMTLCKVILSCLVKSSLSDCNQENLVIHKYVLKKASTELFILCASHTEKWPWTTERTRTTAKEILDLLCDGCRAESVSVLLSGNVITGKEKPLFPQGLLSCVLDVLHSRMMAWPPLSHVVCWCAMQIQYPNVGEHFSRVLPSLLKLIDDHQVINKVSGVQCLHHVMENMNSAELIWYGRIDVIFEVLHRLLYLNEPQLLDKLYPCMLHALNVIKSKSGRTDKQHFEMCPKHWQKYTLVSFEETISKVLENKESDSFMEVILTSMEYESNLQLRRVHAAHLETVVKHMQINLLGFFKRFLTVVLSYLAVSDGPNENIQVSMLQALKTAILHVWPRISGHADIILEALLKLVVDCFDSSSECKEQLLSGCMECIIVLRCCCPDHVKESLYIIKNEVCHAQLQDYIDKVLQNCDGQFHRIRLSEKMVWDFCKGRKRKIEDYEIEVTFLLLILNTVTAVIGTSLNGVVLLAVRRTSSLHAPSRILLASLSLTDLCIGAVVQPICILYFISVIAHWPNIFCLTLLINVRLGYCLGLISMATLTVISIDRCVAIKCKISYRNIVTKKRVLIIITSGWILTFSLFISSIDEFVFLTLSPVLTMLVVSLLLVVTLLCYGISAITLRRLSLQVTSTTAHQQVPPRAAGQFNILKYQHSLCTMAIISLCFVLSYVPLIVINVAQFITSVKNLTIYLNFCELIVMVNSVANPLIYLWRIKEIRQTAEAILFNRNGIRTQQTMQQ